MIVAQILVAILFAVFLLATVIVWQIIFFWRNDFFSLWDAIDFTVLELDSWLGFDSFWDGWVFLFFLALMAGAVFSFVLHLPKLFSRGR